MEIIDIYTDGSFNLTTRKASWAFIVVKNDEVIHKNKGIIDNDDWNTGFQISGECFAVVNALEWAKQNNYKLNLFVDYVGLIEWVADIWNRKPWRTNTEYTIKYRKIVLESKDNINNIIKVKSHSGNKYNELCDAYAKT